MALSSWAGGAGVGATGGHWEIPVRDRKVLSATQPLPHKGGSGGAHYSSSSDEHACPQVQPTPWEKMRHPIHL